MWFATTSNIEKQLRRLEMKRHLICLLAGYLYLVVVSTGCVPMAGPTVAETRLTAEEKQWLQKAYRADKNGWILLHIEGGPFERGFQRGFLTANEIDQFLQTIAYIVKFETTKDLDYFVKAARKLFKGKVSKEYLQEMKGMVAGVRRAGKEVTFQEMLFMNGFIDVRWYWWPHQQREKGFGCSAFVATGKATADGNIVMGHNSWSGYALLRFCNIVIDIAPDKGHRILMQSWGPCIYSATDFFITSAGLVGTETTIGGFRGFEEKGTPVFERARKAMQYANTIEQWADIMIKNNSGAYANSWLLGDIKTGQIARLELGLKHHCLEKKSDGYFSGSNVADSIEVLREETNAAYDDLRSSCVARRERWKQLMSKHYGQINVEIAKQMLADHYDMYLEKDRPSSRTICGHSYLDDGAVPGSSRAFFPGGAIDGKVVDAEMAKNRRFWAKWASSCDIGFDAEQFLERHTQYDWLGGYLKNLPAQPWTIFPPEENE
jgi:hypothetical protein